MMKGGWGSERRRKNKDTLYCVFCMNENLNERRVFVCMYVQYSTVWNFWGFFRFLFLLVYVTLYDSTIDGGERELTEWGGQKSAQLKIYDCT